MIAAATPRGTASALFRASRQACKSVAGFNGGDALLELHIDIVIGVVPAEAAADHDPDGGKDNEGAAPETGFSHGRSLAREPRPQ